MPGKDSNLDFELLWKKIHSNHTEEEGKLFSEWLENENKHEVYFQKVQQYFQKGKVHDARDLDVGQAWETLEPKLAVVRRRKSPDWIKIAGAVAATIVLMLSVYFLLENKLRSPQVAHSQDVIIPPGTSKARLILRPIWPSRPSLSTRLWRNFWFRARMCRRICLLRCSTPLNRPARGFEAHLCFGVASLRRVR